MAFAFRLCLALLGLVSFLLSPASPLAIEVHSTLPNGPESTSIPAPGPDGKPWPGIQPIDPPDPPVPTKLPMPTGTPFLIDTGLVYKITAGEPFLIRIDNYLKTFADGAKVNTHPRVSWVSLDSTHRAITGRVPKDYPTSRVLVFILGRYRLGGRVIDLGYILALEVQRSVSITGSLLRSTPLPTVRTIGSGTSRPTSTHTTTRTTTPRTTLHIHTTPRTTARTTTVRTTTSRTTTSRTTTPHTTTPRTTPRTPTTPLTTARTIPSGLPNPTLFPREKYTIPFDPYKLKPGDIVTSISTEPQSDWVRPNVPLNMRPTSLMGIVPPTQPPGTIKVRLSFKNPATGFLYIVPFTIVVRPEPTFHTLL